MWKKHTDVSNVLALVKIVVASQHKRQRKKSLSKFVDNWTETPTRTWKLVHALHYANELLYASDLPFKNFCKLAKQAETIKNQVLVMIKHCLGNSQINSIPAWRTEFSYTTFLYRTLAKVYALARADNSFTARNQRNFDPKNSPFH